MTRLRTNPLFLAFALCIAQTGCSCSTRGSDHPVDTSTAEPTTPEVPLVTTPAADLEVDGLEHVQVLRITRDFGKETFEIVMDAWLPDQDPSKLELVRLWWFKTDKNGERGPFSESTKRHFDIAYKRVDAGTWKVSLIADDKSFVFNVTADEKGKVSARSTVVSGDGEVEDCDVTSGALRSKKFLGVPTGIDELRVECTGPDGKQHSGRLAS